MQGVNQRAARNWVDRVWIFFFIQAVVNVLTSSNVDPDLWFFTGTLATSVALAYVTALAALFWKPDQVSFHLAAIGPAVLWWVGRGIAFGQLWLDGRPDLRGAVSERALLVVVAVSLHWIGVRRATFFEVRGEYE